MNQNYIKEIQSLRGISIFLVFLFHLNQDYFNYGYLGVDIFFVISGFVITKMIYENLIKEKFNLGTFYASRFLRLFPALFFMVIIVCFLILLTFQIHGNPDRLINTGLFSLPGLSNFYLIFIGNDYFNSFDENIFEHMWSLSIEFQFYIFYPLFILTLFKIFKDKKIYYIYILSLTIIIFMVSNIFFKSYHFYNTGSRIGELLIGCLTFFYYRLNKNYFYILMISLISILIHIFNQNIFYLIISVCFFTSFLILTMKEKKFTRIILNNKFLLVLGDSSYSIYLWHLPVIYFTSLFFSGIDYYFLSILFTLILSSISFLVVEKNFKKLRLIKNFLEKKVFCKNTGIIFALTVIIMLVYQVPAKHKYLIFYDQHTFYNNVLKKISLIKFPRHIYMDISKNINLINFPKINHKQDTECHENYGYKIFKGNCFKNSNSQNIIYFFGDSSMLDFYYSYSNSNIKSDKLFSSYNNSSFEKPFLKNIKTYAKNQAGLIKKPDSVYDLSNNIFNLSKKYKKIFLVMSFNHTIAHNRLNHSNKYYDDQENIYFDLIKILPKNVKLIFIKDTPHFKYSERTCIIFEKISFTLFNKINDNKCNHIHSDVIKKMRYTKNMFDNLKNDSNVTFIDLEKYFCDEGLCKFYNTKNSKTFSKKHDQHHFSLEASRDIEKMFSNKLNQLFTSIQE